MKDTSPPSTHPPEFRLGSVDNVKSPCAKRYALATCWFSSGDCIGGIFSESNQPANASKRQINNLPR
jgi:hypothetical protein